MAPKGSLEIWRFAAAPDDVKAATEPFAITHFHHTLTDWFGAVIDAGFSIEKIGEPMAGDATAAVHPVVADTRIAPLFLHIRARR